MNGHMEYQQSIAAQFLAIKDQVRYFIGHSHWGEDGRYKEVILKEFLEPLMPSNVGIGTGFVKNNLGAITSQIDIIIYKKNDPKLFSKGDFVVLIPQSVLGIIEVKSKATTSVLCSKDKKGKSVIERCHDNGEVIGRSDIFNGIFAYESDMNFSPGTRMTSIFRNIRDMHSYINHICFNSNIFMRFWDEGNPKIRDLNNSPSYSFYNLSYKNILGEESQNGGFAFGYFISNLLEMIYRQVDPLAMSNQYFEFLYPLENGKEDYRIKELEVMIEKLSRFERNSDQKF